MVNLTDQNFKIMFDILTTNLKEENSNFSLKEKDFEIWKNNILNNEKLNTFILENKGYIQFLKENDEYYICEIQIKKSYQGDKTTFRRLITTFMDFYELNETDKINVNINPNNKKSILVFENIGFKNIENNRYQITYINFKKWYYK